MVIDVVRRWFSPTTTISQVYLGSDFSNLLYFGYALENEDSGDEKNQYRGSDRAIPTGTYPLRKRYSKARQRDVYELDAVPGRANILMHSGNDEEDTEGCILFGMVHKGWRIEQSKVATEYIESALNKEIVNRIRIRRDLFLWQEYNKK